MPFIVMVLVACILAGLAIWLLTQFVSDPTIVRIGRAVIVVCLVLWLLGSFFGVPYDWAPRYPHGWR